MKLVNNFCKENKCQRSEKELLKEIKNKDFIILLSSTKTNIYSNLFGKKKTEEITEKEAVKLLDNYKKYLLENICEKIDITKFPDEIILKIEKINKLPKYSLLDDKVYYQSEEFQIYGKKFFGIYSKILREVEKNQIYRNKLKFDEKQKLILFCTEQSYHFSQKTNKYRPISFTDPKHNTIYEYLDDLSNINRSIWKNDKDNIFNRKTIIIAYRGTGVEEQKGKFSFKGYYKRDFKLDFKIAKGKLYKSKEILDIIKDFDEIYKNFGKKYDFYLCGHSLGGRLAFEVHRNRPKKIKQCHIFNAGFGLDVKYLHDIIRSQKRNYDWEKNLYTYHIGGKKKEPGDDDYISVLSGGYGKSFTFYENFEKGLKGHGIQNFQQKD